MSVVIPTRAMCMHVLETALKNTIYTRKYEGEKRCAGEAATKAGGTEPFTQLCWAKNNDNRMTCDSGVHTVECWLAHLSSVMGHVDDAPVVRVHLRQLHLHTQRFNWPGG